MISEKDAVTIARAATGDRRRFVTTISTAVEGPPRAASVPDWALVALALAVVIALAAG